MKTEKQECPICGLDIRDCGHEHDRLAQALIKLTALQSAKDAAEKKVEQLGWICDQHQYPYGLEDTGGPYCIWCERLAREQANQKARELEALILKIYPYAKHKLSCSIFDNKKAASCSCGLSEIHFDFNQTSKK